MRLKPCRDSPLNNLTSLTERVQQEVFTAFSDLHVAVDKIGLVIKAEEEAKENLELASSRMRSC